MGNRAVITADEKIGIYLHWNGGLESVLAFLQIAKERGYRDPVTADPSYGMARLTGLIHEFFGTHTDTSVGIGTLKSLDVQNGNNGLYILGPEWTIKQRKYSGSDGLKTVDCLGKSEMEQYKAMLISMRKLPVIGC